MTLAITIIAVTAIICASASVAALLVASFMPFSLDSGLGEPGFWTQNIVARKGPMIDWIYAEHPSTSIRFDESPLSEHRQSQNRLAIRRHFGPPAAGLCGSQGILRADLIQADDRFTVEPCFESTRRVNHGPHRVLRYVEVERTHQGNS